jgi:flagellar motility protein MotE (MotC chaperone)
MSQAIYRIVPLSIIRYGIEVMRPDKAARILLTCPTEDAANAWMADMKRRSEDRLLPD